MLYAIYSKTNNVTRVHYSHLSESEAINEVDRLNDGLRDSGIPANFWYEEHHPECIFVIA